MIKELNLEKLWNICNLLSERESKLAEEGIYVHLLGHRSSYGETGLEGFLNYYSFRVDGDEIVVFNQDGIPYESYNNDDYSNIPPVLLSLGEKELEKWVDDEIEKQLSQQKIDKQQEKDNLKQQIEQLQKRLNNL